MTNDSTRILRTLLLCSAAFFLPLGGAASADIHLPDQQIFDTPALMILDGAVEEPAVYSGVSVAPGIGVGQQVEFQVFVPRASGEQGFALHVHAARADGQPVEFEIAEVKDWMGRTLPMVAGSNGQTRAHSLPRFDRIPASGHVATVVLNPLTANAFEAPVRIDTWVTFVSVPPRRVWELRGRRILNWF